MGQRLVVTVLHVVLITELSTFCAAAATHQWRAAAKSLHRSAVADGPHNRQTTIGSSAQLQMLQPRGITEFEGGSTSDSTASSQPGASIQGESIDTSINDAQVLLNKPRGDHRQYQRARLRNGIEVLNINDRSTRTAAMAVAVEAGLFYDPPYHYGLAHLTEHSLFLGSQQYPERAGFDEFLARHGGSSNAYTAEEVTVFYANLDTAAFRSGLIRFADIFRAPLLNETCIYKEVSAVVSEHSKNVGNPAWYSERVMLSVGNPKSPLVHFHTGDEGTLKNLGPTNVSKEIQAYFNKNYCPARMHVVTFGSDSLRTQLLHVNETFGIIPRLGVSGQCSPEPLQFAAPDAFPKAKLKQWLLVEGSGSPVLWMLFPLEDLARWHRSHPMNYIEYLVANTARGSLLSILRDVLGLADSVDVSGDDTSAGTMVWFTASLTQQGTMVPGSVMDVIFTYFRVASRIGASERAIQSLSEAAKLIWDWTNNKEPPKAVSDYAEAMTRLDAEELLSGDSLTEEPNKTRVRQVMDMLQPENMNVGLIMPDASKIWKNDPYKSVKTLPHYGVKFNVSELADWAPDYQSWGSMKSTGNDDKDVEQAYSALADRLKAWNLSWTGSLNMTLPGAITDIPQNLTICNGWADKGYDDIENHLWGVPPSLLLSEDSVELWFRRGWTEPQPKVEASMTLRVKNLQEKLTSAMDVVKLQVGMRLLADELQARLYDVGYKGFSFTVSETHSGAYVWLGGFTPNLLSMTDTMIKEMNRALDLSLQTDNASVMLKQVKTTRVLMGLQTDLADNSDEAIKAAYKDQKVLLTPRVHSKSELADALESDITYEQAAEAVKKAREGPFYVTTLILGNYDEDQAKKLHKKLLDGLGSKTGVSASEVERVTPVVKPAYPVELRRRNPREGDKNHVTIISILIGPATVPNRVILGMVGWIYSQIVFDSLRTRKELGYVVGGGVSEMSTIVTVDCYVQGEKMLPDMVEAECENVWHNLVPHEVQNLTQSQFESHKESFKSSLLEGPMKDSNEHAHFEDPILLGGCLQLRTAMLAFLETLSSKDQLVKVWNEAMQPVDSSDPTLPGSRHKVSIKYFGAGADMQRPPSAVEAYQMALKAGLNETAARRVEQERHATVVVPNANSSVREQLVTDGGYFSTELHCDWNATNANANVTFVDHAMEEGTMQEGTPVGPEMGFLHSEALALTETEVLFSGPSKHQARRQSTSGIGAGSSKALMRSEPRTTAPHRIVSSAEQQSTSTRSSKTHAPAAGSASSTARAQATGALLAPQPARAASRQSMAGHRGPWPGQWRVPRHGRSTERPPWATLLPRLSEG
mmetsp:Transcript_139697/g.260529  ORF Transcript_139697/g.260529 Transcript_139697/m.260529 type:complete len:1321 (-) Transcript_139697:16-3978(-)